jgi:cytochrome c oxidase subunit 2
LLNVDNSLIVPSGTKVRVLLTADDVIHAWWVPAFGMKKDAIPGLVNELWFQVDEGKEGLYRGQCAELCGRDHGFMPIVVDVRSKADFARWLDEEKAKATQAAAPAADPSVVPADAPDEAVPAETPATVQLAPATPAAG